MKHLTPRGIGVIRLAPWMGQKREDQLGFTLIEMLLVVAILSIVLSLVLPLLGTTENVLEHEQFFQQLEDDLFLAQQKAITESAVVEVMWNMSAKTYLIRYRHGDMIAQRSFPPGLSVSTNFDRHRFHYNRYGHISQGGRLFFVYTVGERTAMREYIFQVGTGRYRVEKR